MFTGLSDLYGWTKGQTYLLHTRIWQNAVNTRPQKTLCQYLSTFTGGTRSLLGLGSSTPLPHCDTLGLKESTKHHMTDTSKKSGCADTLMHDQTRAARCETSVGSTSSMLLDATPDQTHRLITEMFCPSEAHHIFPAGPLYLSHDMV